jgi:hypothetical protein
MSTVNLTRMPLVAALVAAAALATGCASGPDVRGDYDRAADFGKYRTYNFLSATSGNPAEFQSIAQQMMQQAASREMEARGYTKSENPDLVINFKGKLEEKTDIQSTPAPYYGPAWGYGGWRGAPYGAYGYGGGTEVTTHRYNVGTLVMDVIDREKRQAVFQGGLEDVVTSKMMQDKEGTISNAVAAIFAKYPFVAGQATPVAPVEKK